jgi:hypothetical protein
MAETIHFSSVLILAEAVAGWFYPRNPAAPRPDIPALTNIRLQMVRRLLGMHSERDKTTGQTNSYPPGHAQLLRRLLMAGIDATRSPWQIINEKAARACWFQLRTTETFHQLEQARLMNNAEELPNINIPWQKDVTQIQLQQKLTAQLERAIPEYFMGQVNEHFGRESRPPRKGVGL